MTKRTTTAPYKPGDRIRALLIDRQGGTCLAVVTLDWQSPETVETSVRRILFW
jgi:hypothetical protein